MDLDLKHFQEAMLPEPLVSRDGQVTPTSSVSPQSRQGGQAGDAVRS
jgi:hypothetical protein